ncbi:hypothetical protein FKP32DRAFT_1671631 [Trametes sanguinea]|nr:hypothetical protein FKP32DRAFT_1671631 [Trametes sanguinea]
MSPLSYRQLVANILSDLAKDDEMSISLDTLMERVRTSLELESRRAGPRLQAHVLQAITRERRARRVILHNDASGRQLVKFTDSGVQHFRKSGAFLLHAVDDPKIERLTIPELMNLRQTLLMVTDEIREVLREHDPSADDSLDALAPTVALIADSVETLREQNTKLSAILADNHRAERELMRLARCATDARGDVGHAPVASSSRHSA